MLSSPHSLLYTPHIYMAAPKKTVTKKKPATEQPDSQTPPTPSRRRQVRMAIGLLFLIGGAFTTLAIVSYFFTWKADQDLLMRAGGVKNFVLHGKDAVVANWCGRLGAALSHMLVFRGAGLASLARARCARAARAARRRRRVGRTRGELLP